MISKVFQCIHLSLVQQGKGKSTAIYSILDKLMNHNVKGKKRLLSLWLLNLQGEYRIVLVVWIMSMYMEQIIEKCLS